MSTRPHLEPNFDCVARIYRWAEYLSLGPLLQRARIWFIPQLAGRRHALVLGDGDGRFLAQLLRRTPELQALAVDTSRRMLDLLRQRCDATRLIIRHGSALNVSATTGTDLIVTHFFLDCLTQREVDMLTSRLAQQLQPGTLWLVSDFAVPPRGLVRLFAQVYIRALYAVFRVLTGLRVTHVPAIASSLQTAGFRLQARREWILGIVYTELWTLK